MKYYLLCLQVRKCNIVDETRTETTRVPERKCEKVPSTRRKCGTVTVPQPPMEVTRNSPPPSLSLSIPCTLQVPYTDYKTEYKQQCYNVPKPVCQQRPCTYQVQVTPAITTHYLRDANGISRPRTSAPPA